MHVSVDGNLCQGHARCNLICPEVFDLDEAGFAQVEARVTNAPLDAILAVRE